MTTPRPPRVLPVGVPIHVTNRGNDRRQLFFGTADYQGFLELLVRWALEIPVDVFGYCVMPNHFHLLLGQREPSAISAYLHRIGCSSARMFRQSTATVGFGHVYQRRYWSRPVAHEPDYLAVLRYVEANPVRAQLVPRAEDWQWGSLWERLTAKREVLVPSPVVLPPRWRDIVNGAQPDEELQSIRAHAKRGRPRANRTIA